MAYANLSLRTHFKPEQMSSSVGNNIDETTPLNNPKEMWMTAFVDRVEHLQRSLGKLDEITTTLDTLQQHVTVLSSEVKSLISEIQTLFIQNNNDSCKDKISIPERHTERGKDGDREAEEIQQPSSFSRSESSLDSVYVSVSSQLSEDSGTNLGSLPLKRTKTKPADDNRIENRYRENRMENMYKNDEIVTTDKNVDEQRCPSPVTIATIQNEANQDHMETINTFSLGTVLYQRDESELQSLPNEINHTGSFSDEEKDQLEQSMDNTQLEAINTLEQPIKSPTLTQAVQPIRVVEIPRSVNGSVIPSHPSSLGTEETVDDRIDAPDVQILEESELEDLTLKEANRAADCRDPKSQGADTILCIDTSESMTGDPIKEVKKLVHKFLDGIENVAVDHELDENIALVTFGKETKVQQNLTNDYGTIRESVDILETGGPSPMMTGLVLCLSAIYNRGGVVTYRERKIQPRIILFSDGHVTDQRIFDGPDAIIKQGLKQKEIWQKLMEFGERFRTHAEPRKLICVPVADADMTLLQQLCNTSGGNIHGRDSMKKLSNNFLLNTIAAHLIHDGILADGIPNNEMMVKKIKEFPSASSLENSEFTDIIHMIKQEWETEQVRHSATSSQDSLGAEAQEMPSIGTRVRRGPDWKWNNQDGNAVGTVIAHKNRGWLMVEWDNGNKGKYRYGADRGSKDVRVVEEPRILPPGMLAAVGIQARRGPDWEWGNQDGGVGATGIVFKVEDSGVIHVRWDNGKRGNYRFGLFGKFDIEICESAVGQTTSLPENSKGATASANIGTKLIKWQWQDVNGEWKDHSPLSSEKIENFYQKRGGKGTVIVEKNGENFRVAPEKLHQRGIITGTENAIRRVD